MSSSKQHSPNPSDHPQTTGKTHLAAALLVEDPVQGLHVRHPARSPDSPAATQGALCPVASGLLCLREVGRLLRSPPFARLARCVGDDPTTTPSTAVAASEFNSIDAVPVCVYE